MITSFFLTLCPLIVLLATMITFVAECFWRVYATSRHSKSSYAKFIDNGIQLAAIRGGTVFFAAFITVMALGPISYLEVQSALHITGFQRFQAGLTALAFTIFLSVVNTNIKLRWVQFEVLIFVFFGVVSSVFVIFSTDLLTIFLGLELINAAVIYSFFTTTRGVALSGNSGWISIVSACVYQFVLNFFSSVFLYIFVLSYIGYTGTSSLKFGSAFHDIPELMFIMGGLFLGFLVKLGIGPWIFFKINIYRGMNYILVTIYSVIYLSVIFTFVLNLIFIHNMGLGYTAVVISVTLSLGAALVFASFAFQTSNIMVFLSLSSLLNLTVFLVQGLSIL